eukprot:m.87465 g.87465  ORF g.87465 m.87465 type:complete len:233 (+) comp12831_c1_seq1:267-965(+)
MSSSNPLSGGCPVLHKKKEEQAAAAAAAVPAMSMEEPPDTPDTPIQATHATAKVTQVANPTSPMDEVPASRIPADGGGNSEHGDYWLNPSPRQLKLALDKREKPIEEGDAPDVANVHELVVNMSWEEVMVYEDLHKRDCPNVTLSRFRGMDGIYSIKARLFKMFSGITPFDRHDWTVNRCGKEVTYIIDYYSVDDEDGDPQYFIDCRPAGWGGLADRARIAFRKWRAGQQWW